MPKELWQKKGNRSISTIALVIVLIVVIVAAGSLGFFVLFYQQPGGLRVTNTCNQRNIVLENSFSAITFDPENHDVYIAELPNLVVVISPSNKIIGNMSFPVKLVDGVHYNPATNLLYVTAQDLFENTTIVNGSTSTVVGSTPYYAPFPDASVYNPSKGVYYFGGQENNYVMVVNAKTNAIVRNFSLPEDIGAGLLFDYATGNLYAFMDNGIVNAIDPASGSIIATMSLGTNASVTGFAVDSSNGNIFVTTTPTPESYGNFATSFPPGGLYLIKTASNSLLSIFNFTDYSDGVSPVYNPLNNRIYFFYNAFGSSRLIQVNPLDNLFVSNASLPFSGYLDSMLYDPVNNCVYLASIGQDNVSVVSPP